MWRLTLARGVLFLLSAEYSAVMCGAWPETKVTWPWLRLSMIYCCALRLWSQICVTGRIYWFPDSGDLYCCAGARCHGPEGWLHTYEMITEHFANPYLSVVVAKCWFLGKVVWDRPLCVQSLPQPWPRWPHFWLFTSINGCHADWWYSCLCPVCGRFERPSSGVVGFYHHEPSWSCSFWLRNHLRLRPVGCWLNPCMWWNTWPPDDWCPWPSAGCCCSTNR